MMFLAYRCKRAFLGVVATALANMNGTVPGFSVLLTGCTFSNVYNTNLGVLVEINTTQILDRNIKHTIHLSPQSIFQIMKT